MHSDLLTGSVPHTSNLVHLFMCSLSADSVMSLVFGESLGVSSCSVCVDSDLRKSRDDGSSLSRLFTLPSTKMTLCDCSFFLLESTTMYIESPSKPIRRHSSALSLSLILVSSGTLMKHLEPKTQR